MRVDLRECAAIGGGCRGTREPGGGTRLDPTRAAIRRLGAEAAARLAAIPDTPALRKADRAFLAAYPLTAARRRSPLVRRLRRLLVRYREECGIDRLDLDLALAEAFARCTAEEAPGSGSDRGGDAA